MSPFRVSVVLSTKTGLPSLAPVLAHLRRQTIAARIELIIVAERGAVAHEELAALTGLGRVRLVESDRISSRGRAASRGVLAAEAPLVSLHENHSFLAIDGLERLCAGWSERDAGVCPSIMTANPETRRSLAMLLVAYGDAAAPTDSSPRQHLPYHNATYRADLLQAYGDELEDLLVSETRLQERLVDDGFVLRIDPGVSSWHVNESRWWRLIKDPFIIGMGYAQHRARSWGVGRRAVYVFAFPAVVLQRLLHLVGHGRQTADTRERMLWLMPMLVPVAITGALGETWGYLAPDTPIPEDFEAHEFHISGRLAGVEPRIDWVRKLLALLPAELP